MCSVQSSSAPPAAKVRVWSEPARSAASRCAGTNLGLGTEAGAAAHLRPRAALLETGDALRGERSSQGGWQDRPRFAACRMPPSAPATHLPRRSHCRSDRGARRCDRRSVGLGAGNHGYSLTPHEVRAGVSRNPAAGRKAAARSVAAKVKITRLSFLERDGFACAHLSHSRSLFDRVNQTFGDSARSSNSKHTQPGRRDEMRIQKSPAARAGQVSLEENQLR